jgi:death-on-curing protein
VILLTLEELLVVAERALGQAPVVRDIGLLESAFGADAYASLEERAAAFVHSLVRNHALIDGNKRLGLSGLIVLLGVNGRRLTWTNDEAYEFIVEIAEGRLDDVPAIADRIVRGSTARSRR